MPSSIGSYPKICNRQSPPSSIRVGKPDGYTVAFIITPTRWPVLWDAVTVHEHGLPQRSRVESVTFLSIFPQAELVPASPALPSSGCHHPLFHLTRFYIPSTWYILSTWHMSQNQVALLRNPELRADLCPPGLSLHGNEHQEGQSPS